MSGSYHVQLKGIELSNPGGSTGYSIQVIIEVQPNPFYPCPEPSSFTGFLPESRMAESTSDSVGVRGPGVCVRGLKGTRV